MVHAREEHHIGISVSLLKPAYKFDGVGEVHVVVGCAVHNQQRARERSGAVHGRPFVVAIGILAGSKHEPLGIDCIVIPP